MESLKKILTDAHVLPILAQLLLPEEECYLVGGGLRDWLLGRAVTDFDFATPGDPTSLAQRFAARVGGRWFFLDEARRQSRVMLKREGGQISCDFAPFRGPDLAADLLGRDFTVNALALPLTASLETVALIDPLGGLGDLADRLLRACTPDSFAADPLRILKGVRHAVTLDFVLEAQTRLRMREQAELLGRTAGERIRAELAAILAVAPAASGLELLRGLGLLPVLFGAGSEERYRQGAQLVEAIEAALARAAEADDTGTVAGLGREAVGDGFERLALLKLAAFLRGRTAVDLSAVLERLHLSRRNAATLRSLSALPAERAAELTNLPVTGRGRALWVAGLGPSAVDALLFLAALEDGLRLDLLLGALRDFQAAAVAGRIPDLIGGDWVRSRLGLCGPAVGMALARLRREEVAGRVRTAKEGERFLLLLDKKSLTCNGAPL